MFASIFGGFGPPPPPSQPENAAFTTDLRSNVASEHHNVDSPKNLSVLLETSEDTEDDSTDVKEEVRALSSTLYMYILYQIREYQIKTKI